MKNLSLLFFVLISVGLKAQPFDIPLVVGTDVPGEHSVRFATFYDSNLSSGHRYLNFGKNNTTYNCGEIAFYHISDNSASNFVSVGMYNQTASQRLYLFGNGNVGIGTITPKSKLSVNGTIISTEIKMLADISQYPDFVFSDNYKPR